jgi:hypothetical protein
MIDFDDDGSGVIGNHLLIHNPYMALSTPSQGIYPTISPLLGSLCRNATLKASRNLFHTVQFARKRYTCPYTSQAIKMPHAKAVVAGRTIAETDEYEVVEGNIYVNIDPRSSHGITNWQS